MTVGELIEKLKGFDPDTWVRILDIYSDGFGVADVSDDIRDGRLIVYIEAEHRELEDDE